VKLAQLFLESEQDVERQISRQLGVEAKILRIPNKQWRSEVIADYVRNVLGHNKVIVFSCGNAARALKEQGLDVISGGPPGKCDFVPDKWYSPEEIAQKWPDRFDATSGHLTQEMMQRIAQRFKSGIGPVKPDNVIIPTGSGETIFCLKLAYPDKNFIALYDEDDPATKFEESNPFNRKVRDIATMFLRTSEGTKLI
jgi:hypothetical protein